MKTVKRYSEAFKSQVVDEISRGKFASISAASKAYGITGSKTVVCWVKKYGRDDLLPRRIRIEKMNEINQLKVAKKRNRDLEVALADAQIDNCLEHAFLQIACERMGISLADFKKKNALTLSDVRKMRDIS